MEEPRVQQALQGLMEMLDQEVPKALIGHFPWRGLDKEVVLQAEESLSRPDRPILQQREMDARSRVEAALREWLEAANDSSHFRDRAG